MRSATSLLLLTLALPLGLGAAELPAIKVAVYDDKGATGKGTPA